GIMQRSDAREPWDDVAQHLKPFRAQFRGENGHAGDVAAGPRETSDESCANDVVADRDYRYRSCRLLGDAGRQISAGENGIHFQPHQFGGELGKLLRTSLPIAQLDRDVLAFDQTRCAQSLPKRFHPGEYRRRVGRPQQADRGHATLLSAGGKRPRRSGGADERDDVPAVHPVHSRASGNPGTTVRSSGSPLSRGRADFRIAPHHSITSSAATSRPGGTVSPSAFAVLRLSTVSYLVGACTGRSAGFAPRRMRSM